MKKHYAITGDTSATNIKKMYILTQPTKLSDLTFDDFDEDGAEAGWREKSRQMQARRWRKIRHQVV